MRGWRGAAYRLAPAALALLLLAAPAAAGERVGVDAGLHDGYARIVFAWPAKVGFAAKLEGGKLAIHFARPFTADLAVIARRIDDYVETVAKNGDSDVVATLRRSVALRSFATEDKVVVDLLDQPGAQPAPPRSPDAAAHEAAPASAKIEVATEAGGRRIVFDWPKEVAYALTVKGGEAELRFKRSGPTDIAHLAAEAPDLSPQAKRHGRDLTVTLRLPPGSHIKAVREGRSVVAMITTAASKGGADDKAPAAPAPAAAVPKPAAAPPTPLVPPAARVAAPPAMPVAAAAAMAEAPDASAGLAALPDEPAPLPPRVATSDDGATLRFELHKPVPAAIFREGAALWIVFGAPVAIDLADLRAQGQDVVRSIDRVPSDAATILRVATAGGFNPSVRRSETGWVVDLRRQLLQPDAPIGVSIQPTAQPPRILLGIHEPGAPVRFRDPELGETLIAVPVVQAGQGVAREQDLVDVTLLMTAQGIALRPASDGIEAKPLPNGVEVTSTTGLILSGEHDRALRRGDTPQRLFDFADWYGPRDGDVLAERRALEQNIVAAAPAARSGARLDLAHFYFAHGLGAEALGVLAAIQRDDPAFAADPRVRAVTGGALLLTDRPDEAGGELGLPALDGEAEIGLWRGGVAYAKHDFPRAAAEFGKAAAILRFYPKRLRHRFALEAAEAAIAIGQPDDAQDYLALVKDAPNPGEAAEAKFLVARALQLGGEGDSARAILDRLAMGNDRETRARAQLARTLDDLGEGKISRGAAIKALDALRFAWRGDDFELTLPRRLAELEIKDGNYRAGFAALRQALENFPNHPERGAVQQQLSDAFSDIFIGNDADSIPPLKALALYDEFKGLMPSGGKGDEIIRRLADRLVAMDLLDRAATLLEDQVRNRLAGRDKARVAARLALVRLLDHKPQQAIAALDIDVGTAIDPDLERQRQQLRARALSDLGKTAEALKILEGDDSRDAERLRADIAWRTKDWHAAAQIFERLAVLPDAAGKLAKDDAQTILDWATALTLTGDRDGVARLAKTYAAAMDASPFREAFRVVAGDPSAAEGDIRQLVGKVAQVGDLQSFMAGYRQKLSAKSLSAIN